MDLGGDEGSDLGFLGVFFCLFLFKIDVTSLLMGSWRPCHSLCELIPYAASAQMNDIYKGQRMTVGTAHKEQAAYQVYTYNV